MNRPREQFLLFRIRVFKDERAFAEIYEDYAPGLLRFLTLKLPTVQDANDVHSHMFLRLWNYATVAKVEHVSGLLFTIAKSLIADFYRRRKATAPLEEAEQMSEASAVGHTEMMEGADRALEVKTVKRLLAQLSEEDQLVIQLRFFEELSLREIADRIEKSVNATAMMIHRAMKRLKALAKDV